MLNDFNSLRKILAILSIWVGVSIVLVLGLEINQRIIPKVYFYRLSLIRVLIGFFLTNNLLVFYLIFELSLIPIFILVLGWGYQPERIKAGVRLLFYTLTGSLPLLRSLMFLMSKSRDSTLIFQWGFLPLRNLVFFFRVRAFLIKTPIFLVHLWLPKAHVEAPIYGSILLAALLLKLGTFGVLIFIIILRTSVVGILIFRISLVSTVRVSALCIRLLDIKIIIAYSSVAHIGMVLFLLYLNFKCRIQRAILIIVAHGFTSAALFYMAHLLYLRSHTRILVLNKMLIVQIPSLSLLLFLVVAINLAAPPTVNLLAELLIVISLLAQVKILRVIVVFMVLTRSIYTIILYSSVSQPTSSLTFSKTQTLRIGEFLNTAIYLFPGWRLVFVIRIIV